VRLLRHITEQRAAQRAHLAQIAERQRLWQAEMDAEAESWRQLRHAQCMAVLSEIAGRCMKCGNELEAVRPGRWQCNYCEAALDAAGGQK